MINYMQQETMSLKRRLPEICAPMMLILKDNNRHTQHCLRSAHNCNNYMV